MGCRQYISWTAEIKNMNISKIMSDNYLMALYNYYALKISLTFCSHNIYFSCCIIKRYKSE